LTKALHDTYNSDAYSSNKRAWGKDFPNSMKLRLGSFAKAGKVLSEWLIFSLGLIVSVIAVAAVSDDPWRDRDYKAWTADEVEKILYESPWVKMVEVGAPWLKGSSPHFLMPMSADCNGRPNMNRGERTPASWATGSMESIVIYQVTWQSARTVRSAKYRQASLCGRADLDRGDDILDQEQEQYVIIVNSPDMSPFESLDEDGLIKNTSLLFKKSGKKIAPASVQLGRFGGGKALYNLTFKFPKKADNGEPLLSPDEKEIEFVSQSGKFVLRTRFQTNKMVAKGKVDL
jgi:hypothetical protein